ncbi:MULTISPECIES: hypothetical protein [unclassified Schaalia]|uniref:hypothetical protein n=1 Tax=unclassified Schaalia TaxID=2691889 RepID=UPI001E4F48AA|nr:MULTISPECIES: hypothetical protein [unclassified Schaalia]MCD4550027.1 hypothetical protein [Schaalia sp. lx-260]MCD4557905.1 hypothetical protein [Schaalia sp. lx-100]
MYNWIFRHLPGPTWLKIIESLILIAAIVAALFVWVFPWAQSYLNIGDANVG